jgi:hypothetical protein
MEGFHQVNSKNFFYRVSFVLSVAFFLSVLFQTPAVISSEVGFANLSKIKQKLTSFESRMSYLRKLETRLIQQILTQKQSLLNKLNSSPSSQELVNRRSMRSSLRKRINYLELRRRRARTKVKAYRKALNVNLRMKVEQAGKSVLDERGLDSLVLKNISEGKYSRVIVNSSVPNLTDAVLERLISDDKVTFEGNLEFTR